MSLEHSPARTVGPGHNGGPPLDDNPEFWFGLINEPFKMVVDEVGVALC